MGNLVRNFIQQKIPEICYMYLDCEEEIAALQVELKIDRREAPK